MSESDQVLAREDGSIVDRWRITAIGEPDPEPVVDARELLVRREPIYATAPRGRAALTSSQQCPQPGASWTWLVADHDTPAPTAGEGVALVGEWPDPILGWPRALVVTCSPTPESVTAAAKLVRAWASGQVADDVEIVALAVIHPPRPRRSQRRSSAAAAPLLAALGGAVSEVLEIRPATGNGRRRSRPPNDDQAAVIRINTLLDHLEQPPRKETR